MIKTSAFTGLAPRIHARKLPETAAQTALDVRLLDGNLTPLKEAETTGVSVLANCKSFYPFNSSYLAWTTAVDVVKNPLVNDTYGRVYYTGDGVPKSAAIISTVTALRALGIPAPTGALTLSGTPAKTSVSWTRHWYSFWEETDGVQSDAFDFGADGPTPNPNAVENVAGAQYTTTNGGALPPGAGGTKVLTVWFEGYSSTGVYLGKCYPATSKYAASTDLVVNGAAVACTQSVGATSVTTELQYNTSRQTGFDATRVYVYTWVTDVGEESAPSPPLTVEVSPVQNVDLVISTTAPYAWVTHKRVYRSVTDSSGQTSLRLVSFSAVTDVPIATSNITDSLLDDELELDVLATEGFDPPPADLNCLVSVPGGFFAGSSGRTVYFSEPYLPYAWPYSRSFDAPIKAMAVAGNSLVIATEQFPYLLTGYTPDGMGEAKLPLPMAGVSKRGIIAWQGRVMYVSPDGLVEVLEGGARLATESIVSRAYWQALTPATMRLYTHDDMLIIGCDTKTLIFTYADGAVTFTESALVIDAAYLDVALDVLKVVLHGETAIKTFNTGANRTMTWRGKDAVYAMPQKMGAYRVQAASYPLTMTLYADDASVATVTVTQGKAAVLPSLPPAKVWSVAIESDDTVYSVETAPAVFGILQ